MLAAVLVAVGVLVQIMALTGVRGWLVINAMSFQSPWIYVALAGLPLLGWVLTSIGAANSLGVPFAFAFIHQDMILNISALSALAALSEFCPPTAISTALAAYVVGADRLWPIIRAALADAVAADALAVADADLQSGACAISAMTASRSMTPDIIILWIYRGLALVIAVAMVVVMIRSRDWRTQFYAMLVFVVFALRAAGIK